MSNEPNLDEKTLFPDQPISISVGENHPESRLPGKRAALPPGTLSKTYFGPQGDQHMTPPPNAPSPVNPVRTVPSKDVDRK